MYDRQTDQLIETIRGAVIGADEAIEGPYGARRVTYADYTASGRNLSFIEEFLLREVMPFYANTHTEASGTGLQTTRYREDARAIIHKAVGGGEEDLVVFTGSGATAAIDKLIGLLNLRIPKDLDTRYGLSEHIPAHERPVVFIGPYEHHSNEVAWRETIADVVVIAEDADGRIDIAQLEEQLVRFKDRSLKIGSFSAASNVSGIVSDTSAVATLLHTHGALSFWDFAAAGPYVDINMNLPDLAYKDAIFLSPHKFAGGPGTPGVLVAKRSLFKNTVPVVPGGGTVAYVNVGRHEFLTDPIHREEGGTPAILESIRAGLVFQLKEDVGPANIERLEQDFIGRAIAQWSENPHIRVLGNSDAHRLSIVSFVVQCPDSGYYLHHNLVVALLNDVFGIQARGGCSCAGPYGHRLLGIDLPQSEKFACQIMAGLEGIKPGWARINFNYFISETVFQFLVDAVDWVATHGWKLLDDYTFNVHTGLWTNIAIRRHCPMRLTDVSFGPGGVSFRSRHMTEPESALSEYIDEANRILAERRPMALDIEPFDKAVEDLRWFAVPGELGRPAV
jgi:selenocysteine lyase/cysteine desulfurase